MTQKEDMQAMQTSKNSCPDPNETSMPQVPLEYPSQPMSMAHQCTPCISQVNLNTMEIMNQIATQPEMPEYELTTYTPPKTPAKNNTLWHGLGLFGESYLLFSIGTLSPIWQILYPQCFENQEKYENYENYNNCPEWMAKSLSYSTVLGVMLGMVLVGSLANSLGRRKGSILTAALMTTGSFLLLSSSIIFSSRPTILFPLLSSSLFLFGVGVGGEYPMSASLASERAMSELKRRRQEEQLSQPMGQPMGQRGLGGNSGHVTGVKEVNVAGNHYILQNDQEVQEGNQQQHQHNELWHHKLCQQHNSNSYVTPLDMDNINTSRPWQTLGRTNSPQSPLTSSSPHGSNTPRNANLTGSLTDKLHNVLSSDAVIDKTSSSASNSNDLNGAQQNTNQYTMNHTQTNNTANNTHTNTYLDTFFRSYPTFNSLYSSSTQSTLSRTNHGRGRQVLLVFSMQGMGIFVNSLVLTFLLMMARLRENSKSVITVKDDEMNYDDDFNDRDDGGIAEDNDGGNNSMQYNSINNGTEYYESSTLISIWVITYVIGFLILFYVLLSRIWHLEESQVWREEKMATNERMKKEKSKMNEEEEGREFREFIPPTIPTTTTDPCKEKGDGSTNLVSLRDSKYCRTTNLNTPGVAHPSPQKCEETSPSAHQHHQYHRSPNTTNTRRSFSHSTTPRIRKSDSSPRWMGEAPTLSSLTMKSEFEGLGSTNMDGCKLVPIVEEEIDDSRKETILLLQHYGLRLFGTSMTWLLWDIAFYGNKLFQSSFLLALTGDDASLIDITCASAINAFVALLGYYVAAIIVDDPDVGRLSLQQSGFIITGTLFLLCGCLSERLPSSWLVIMYFGSSFFGQCGPNCTTFLIPAEIFPTEMRTMCHGISASFGKLGALIASILFHFLPQQDLFLFSGYASFIACLISFLTIPETTTLDLFEIDKQWRYILDGRTFEYEGAANDPRHLSFYERNQNELCCGKT